MSKNVLFLLNLVRRTAVCFGFHLRSCFALNDSPRNEPVWCRSFIHSFICFRFSLNSEAKMVAAEQTLRVQTSDMMSGFHSQDSADQNEIWNEPVASFHRFSRFTCMWALHQKRATFDRSENHVAYLGLRGRLGSSKPVIRTFTRD